MVNLLSDPNLLKILTDNGVDIAAVPNDPTGNVFMGIFQQIAFPLFFFGGLALINAARMKESGPNMMNDPNNPFNIGKSKAKVEVNPNTGVTFTNVAGVDEAKEELAEIVDFLK